MDIFEQWQQDKNNIHGLVALTQAQSVAIAHPDWQSGRQLSPAELQALETVKELFGWMQMAYAPMSDVSVLWLLANQHPFYQYYIKNQFDTVTQITGRYK
jgi:hypothetical protein